MLHFVDKQKFVDGRKSKYGYYYIFSFCDGVYHYLKSYRSLSSAKNYLNRRINNLVSKYPHIDFSNLQFMIAYRVPGVDFDEYEYFFDYVKE